MSIGASYWRRRLARWPAGGGDLEPGYTVLVPVPGDLPVFVELALAVIRHQVHTMRASTMVIPDRPTRSVEAIVGREREDWPGPLELEYLPRPERWFLPLLKSGSRNHGMQLVAGASKARSTHVVLHDADLFILDPGLLERQYAAARQRGLACLGVSQVWDPWFARHGRRLAATWDMVADTAWLRAFPPAQHIGHDAELWGEMHTFDTTLHPQAVTPAELIDYAPAHEQFVHFNYVISAYRKYQRARRRFVDANFRLLLIGLFGEVFGQGPGAGQSLGLGTLNAALAGRSRRLAFPSPEEGESGYGEFRKKLEAILEGPFVGPERRVRGLALLEPFDSYYSYCGRVEVA